MKLLNFEIPYNNSDDEIILTGLGDFHIGQAGFDEEKLNNALGWIRENNAYVLLMGDLLDCISPTDKRYDAGSMADEFRAYVGKGYITKAQEKISSLLQKIDRERIVGFISGNHEDETRKHHEIDIPYEISRDLGINNLGMDALIRLVFIRKQHKSSMILFAHHGHGAGFKVGQKLNKIEDMSQGIDADLYMMGHVHNLVTHRDVIISIPRRGRLSLVERTRAYMLTGTFCRTYVEGHTTYAEQRMYRPVKLGCASFKINPESKDIHLME